MIQLFEGSGGFTVRVTNGDRVTNLECTQYEITRCGVPWFDLDAAMRDAERIDEREHAEMIDTSTPGRAGEGDEND
jgi:hypothetical protein